MFHIFTVLSLHISLFLALSFSLYLSLSSYPSLSGVKRGEEEEEGERMILAHMGLSWWHLAGQAHRTGLQGEVKS